MRVRLIAPLVLMALHAAAGGTLAAAAPATPIPAAVARDSAGKWLQGSWKSDVLPDSLVKIVLLGRGVITVRCAGRFEAIGYVAGGELRCVARSRRGAPSWSGTLRARWTGEGMIAAEFVTNSAGAPRRSETWKLVDSQGAFAGPALARDPGSTPGDSLPGLDDPTVGVEEFPVVLEHVAPSYPEAARRAGISGTVEIMALIGRDGLVKATRVRKSVPGLDDAARDAVRQWRFKPALADGEPRAVWIVLPVRFSLH